MKHTKGFVVVAMVIAIAILVAVAGVGIVIQKKNISQRVQETAKQVTTVAEPTRIITSAPKAGVPDATLDKDFSDIDTSMNAINADATSIDTGLNDQIGDLSE